MSRCIKARWKAENSKDNNEEDSGDNNISNFTDDIENKSDEADSTLFTAHGKEYHFCSTSLNMFDNKNIIRKICVWIACWKWFDRIIIGFIILNSLFLGIMDYTDNENKSWRNQLSVQTEPVFTTIFTLECVIKIVGTGLIIGKGTYLSDPWNWIDFFVVISGLLTAVPQVENVSALRTFRLFRPLRSLSTLSNIRILIGTLLSSVAQLGGVLGLALFFFLIFAILGVNLFAGLEDFRCRETQYPVNGDWTPYPNDVRLCGNRVCSEGWCGSLVDAYDNAHNITVTDLYRDSNISELNYGLTNFDNIVYAFLTIFQCITLEGWSDIMYMMQDAYSKWISSIYFVLVTVICAYFLINLTIAVMLKNYDELDKNEKNTTHQANLIELGMNAKLPSRLIYFIVGEENLIINKKAKKRLRDHEDQMTWQQKLIKNFVYAKVDIPNEPYYKWKITRFFYFLVSMPMFGTIIMICILSNTIILSLQRYPMPADEDYAYNIVNNIFTCIFALEVILKLIAHSPKKFILDKFNIFDSLVVLVSFSDFFVSSGGGGVSALRAFRLFRIFKLFRTGNLRVLLDSIAYTMSTIGNYVILLSLFIYVYSLLGMQFFAGQLRFDDKGYYDPNGKLARSNFDTLYWASITVFEVLIGDNWNNIMYDCMLGAGKLSAIYFITLILFGNIIMLNLFLAILLGNFDKARTFWLKKSIFEMFEVAIEKKYSLSKAINIILGEVSKSVKEELLVHEPRDIFRLNGRLSIINRKLMINDPEAEDKLIYYDKVADFVLEYQPITNNQSHKEDDFEGQELDEFENNKDKYDVNESSMHIQQNNDNPKLFYDEEVKQNIYNENQENINHSDKLIPELVNNEEHKANKTFLKSAFAKKSKEKYIENDISNNDQDEISQEKYEYKRFVTLGSPRVKIEDLDESNEPKNKGHRRFLSVSFDLSNLKKSKEEREFDKNQNSKDEIKDEDHDFFKDEHLVEVKTAKWYRKVYKYCSESSLFIFHKDSKIRKLCCTLIISPEMKQEFLANERDEQPDFTEIERQESFVINPDPEVVQKQDASGNIEEDKHLAAIKENKRRCKHPSKYFDYFIIALILLSSLMLVLDNPLNNPNSQFSKALDQINFVFTFLFVIEMCIKVIALGFMHSSIQMTPYIRNGWNILDFTVVLASLFDIFTLFQDTGSVNTSQLKSLKALRALRALRPLRMISRNEGMRLVVNALFAAIPPMTNVLIVCMLFVLIFACTGISFFAGMFYSCSSGVSDSTASNWIDLGKVVTKFDCYNYGGQWHNSGSNFDNVFQASLTLFQMITTEGWMTIMYNGIDATDIDKQPIENNNIGFAIFFIAFMIVGSMLILNLFVGVVIDNFNKIKVNEELGNMFVTESQKKWIEIQRIIMRKKLKFQAKLPQSGIRYGFLQFATSRLFDWSITACIFANTIVMSIRYSRMSDLYSNVLEYFNLAFAIIFNFEAVIKIIAFGKSYFNYSWNKFDLSIVIGTDIGLFMNVVNVGINISTIATVVRAFRIMRIFRLVKSSQNMRIILDTISHILPQIMNIMSLVFLLLFIYSILGMNLFATVMYQDYYNDRANFRTFEDSILLLYRCMTGESWYAIMDNLSLSTSYNGVECQSSQSYEQMQHDGVLGCGTTVSYFYFVSYMILLSMIIMNLSVAAVIEGLYEANKENTGIVSGDQIDFLIEKWCDYDTKATGLISYRNFLFLLYEVPPPLGMGMNNSYNSEEHHGNAGQQEEKKDDIKNYGNVGIQDRYIINEEKRIYIKKSDAIRIFNDYDIPLYGQNIHFKDVAKALVESIFKKNKLSYDLTSKIQNRLKKQWEGKYTTLRKINPVEGIDIRIVEPAKIIMRYFKNTQRQKEERSFKKGKTLFKSSTKNLKSSFVIKSQRKSLPNAFKIDEAQMFTQNRIDTFLEQGETDQIKNDKSYDAFRVLMNEKNLNYEDPFVNINKKREETKNEFRWLNDPTYRIESDSSEEDKANKNQENLQTSLNPQSAISNNKKIKFADKEQMKSNSSKLKSTMSVNSPAQSKREHSYKETTLSHPKKSKLLERRKENMKFDNDEEI